MATSASQAAAAGPLLDAKLSLPLPRPALVPRRRLLDRLDAGLEGKLILVSAPAGFGKTTLLAEWLNPAGRGASWISLDERDNDAAQFWSYVVAALRTVQDDVGDRALALLRSPQPPPIETILGTLVNEIAAEPDDFVLVLDDYHVIETPSIQDGIAFLIDHMPRQLHLVIASRADPPLPLSRLRARGQLTELRAADLRFTDDEAASFLGGVMGLDLSTEEVAALEARTEGWIAGLQLAALSMQGRDDVSGFIAAFAGDDRYIVDYLVEEVLDRQPAGVRRFLLETSILERLSGRLCDALTGGGGGAATLGELERANLFVIPLDDKRRWYRYHHLFADILRTHLMEEQPELVPELHGRASAWFDAHGDPAEAIRHALAAPDLERAATLIELAARSEVRSYRPDRMGRWLRAVPDEIVRARPVLSTYYAYALSAVGDFDGAERRLRDAERWLEGASRPGETRSGMVVADEQQLAILPATIALARAFCAQAVGDTDETRAQAGRALERLPADDHLWRGGAAILLALAHWSRGDLTAALAAHDEGIASLDRAGDVTLAVSAAYDGADLRLALGQLEDAERLCERWLRTAEAHAGAVRGTADLHLGLAALQCERGDLEAAAGHLRSGEDAGEAAALPEFPYRQRVTLARLRRAEGDLDGAGELLDEAERRYVLGPVPDRHPVAALRARLWVAAGRIDEALRWARGERLAVDDELEYRREFEHVTLAAALIARGRRDADSRLLEDALSLLGRLLEAADTHARTGSVLEILILRALALEARGDAAGALEPLARALELAAAEGYVRLFVDEGEPMRGLLRHAAAAGISTGYVTRLLAAFEGPRGPSMAHGAAAALAEPLTPREVEILRLVAAGMRNQEIADQLVISVATVKRHIANAYGKLAVTHRTEAVARAAELDLL